MSFRIRLFLMTCAIVVAVLVSVIGLGWSIVLNAEIERLDQRLCQEAKRLARDPRHAENPDRLTADMLTKLRLGDTQQLMMQVNSSERDLVYRSPNWPASLDISALPWRLSSSQRGKQDRCALAPIHLADGSWHMAMVQVEASQAWLGANLAGARGELQGLLGRAMSMIVIVALGLTALTAWMLSGWMMQPVRRLQSAMAAITPQGLDQRLPTAGESQEFRALIDSYNTMLARLQASFQQASRFSADAAHELKTPLTILRGQLEHAVLTAGDSPWHAELASMLDEVGRLSMITRKLLLLSQADAGQLALHRSKLDISNMLNELLADAQLLLSEQKLRARISPNLHVMGDDVLLEQLFNNLLSNAVRYGLPNGWINVVASSANHGVDIVFSNNCPPIAAASRVQFFDRFYRGDAAHNRTVDGSGLGLSLAREIAHAHGGTLTLEPSTDNEVHLRLWLPAQ